MVKGDRAGLKTIAAVLLSVMMGATTTVAVLGTGPAQPYVLQPVTGEELLLNPSFEGRYYSRGGINEVTIAEAWSEWYCDVPYTPAKCPVPLIFNPYERFMQRPEYTPSNPFQLDCFFSSFLNRVHSGCNSQHFFGFSKVIRAGVKAKITGLIPGTYQLSAWFQIWSNGETNAKGCVRRDSANNCVEWMADTYTSSIASQHDRDAMKTLIGYDPTCGNDAFASTVIWSAYEYGYAEGLYDNWRQVGMPVEVTGTCVTVFLGGYSRYANYHNDFYVDDASFRLLASDASPVPTLPPNVTPTRTPTAQATATPTRTPTPAASCPTPVVCQPPVEVTRIVEVTRVVVATQGAGPTPTRIPTGTQPPAEATPLGGDPIMYRVIVSGLHLRAGPFTTATSYIILPFDTIVEYEGEKQFGWIRVRYGGLVGWMYGLYLEEVIVPKE